LRYLSLNLVSPPLKAIPPWLIPLLEPVPLCLLRQVELQQRALRQCRPSPPAAESTAVASQAAEPALSPAQEQEWLTWEDDAEHASSIFLPQRSGPLVLPTAPEAAANQANSLQSASLATIARRSSWSLLRRSGLVALTLLRLSLLLATALAHSPTPGAASPTRTATGGTAVPPTATVPRTVSTPGVQRTPTGRPSTPSPRPMPTSRPDPSGPTGSTNLAGDWHADQARWDIDGGGVPAHSWGKGSLPAE
jgi:hypothetical protein